MNDPRPELDPELDVDWWASRLVDREIDFADVPADLRAPVQERSASFATQRRSLLRVGAEHTLESSVTDAAIVAARRPPEIASLPRRRRLTPLLAMAAASVGVIAIGANIFRSGDSPVAVTLESQMVITDLDGARSTTDEIIVESAPKSVPGVAEDDPASAMAVDDTQSEPSESEELTDLPPESTSVTVEISDLDALSDLSRSWSDSSPPLLSEAPACDDDRGRRAIDLDIRFAGIDAQAYFSPEAGVILRAVSDCEELASIVP
ncbi:MAG: hypothetical protein O3C62_01050 [Actinomycetota bacterium]|nr:hypothetical protein [Actinomycetota bacterium]MDA2971624.1 hypothetical protein [Actinomycetota bacterium]MDA3000252.1 hypothetical protein [Actinomycetota bacterium]